MEQVARALSTSESKSVDEGLDILLANPDMVPEGNADFPQAGAPAPAPPAGEEAGVGAPPSPQRALAFVAGAPPSPLGGAGAARASSCLPAASAASAQSPGTAAHRLMWEQSMSGGSSLSAPPSSPLRFLARRDAS